MPTDLNTHPSHSASSHPPRLKVLLTSTARYPFVQDDIEVLARHFDLEVYIGSGVRGAWEHFWRAFRADVSFSWFGSVYTFFMVLGARLGWGASMVMLGGADVANEPAINYGIWRTPWKAHLLSLALRAADRVFAVDASLRDSLERSSGRRWDKVEVLPTGYDIEAWTPMGEKEPRVLCVAGCNSTDRVKVKGIDLLIEAARRMPETPFMLIGVVEGVRDLLAADAPANLLILPPLPRGELLRYYRAAAVYCQPSRREGLPNAMCEAMLCGCVPVVSDVGGMPAAVSGAGFVVPTADVEALCDAIRNALDAPAAMGFAARENIVHNFPRERREEALVRTIGELAGAHHAR